MVDIVRLRMAGFKSFVEPVEMTIQTGLTGVVGPNGCGKSNVVEALRWAMGETSARQLRGGGMDDVIFAGAAGRPARNHAEVSIGLIDRDGGFPSPWFGQGELEIVRRIERGAGSGYRVNGREARARDVQTLFADLSSGARSAAIVSQGQIGAFIIAKPEQRRSILEEAAGVAGLRARRHEATLRLNAAETNLERLEDVLIGIDNQLAALQKQARQARRFRKLSDLIRAAEAQAFIARLRLAEAALAETDAAAKAAEAAVVEATRQAASAERLAVEATAALPPARREEAEAAAAQQRLRLELERIEAERRRRADAKSAAAERLRDAQRDRERERARADEAAQAAERLAVEAAGLEAAAAELAEPAIFDARIAERAAAAAAAANAANAQADTAAEAEATGRAAKARLQDAETRLARAAQAAAAAEAAWRAAEAAAPDAVAHADAVEAAKTARTLVETRQTDADAARAAAETARVKADASREARAEAAQARTALATETKTLQGLLRRSDDGGYAPALDQVRAAAGYETALGAALGDDLEAALDAAAPAFWATASAVGATPALPDGAAALDGHVTAPEALRPRLRQIGVVDDWAAGERCAGALAMGQRLVSRAGDVWRWDGLRRRAGAESAAARRLALQNRLAEALRQLETTSATAEAASAAAETAGVAAKQAAVAEQTARDAARQARQAADAKAEAAARLERAAAAHAAGLAAKAEAAAQAARQKSEAETTLESARAALVAAPESGEAKAKAEDLRGEANLAQLALAEARGERQRLEAAKSANATRRRAVAEERARWTVAAEIAAAALAALADRQAAAEAQISAADAGDANEDGARAELLDKLEVAEARRRTLADTLAKAEAVAAERAAAARVADAAAASAREVRIAAQGAQAQSRQAVETLHGRIRERLDAEPTELADVAGVDPDTVTDDKQTLERRVDRLRRERDSVGAVNLRAEAEIEEIETQAETIRREREDLVAAIAKLRRGVAAIAGEARQRLRAAFDKIDAHFSEIFQRLFGGGRARLALVGSDDPLEAGLEIMASPPGKALQTLSLLSGGERALTALALVFAAFRVNPSPICVLDEIDAPLDDSNVDRVCALLEEMAADGATRFLVITHHRMTMARMDRLYGVTMPERGVSQLVSVDFEGAQALREAG